MQNGKKTAEQSKERLARQRERDRVRITAKTAEQRGETSKTEGKRKGT
jgi:hypothetical protein